MRNIKNYTTFLKENINTNYIENVDYETEGDIEYERPIFISQLDMIYKYFPFTKVSGHYTTYNTHLIFDTFEIKGVFEQEPFMVEFIIDDNIYNFDIHPFDGMGGLDISSFENNIKQIKNELDSVSIVITNDLYATKSITLRKDELDDYEIYIVDGTQIEGKQLGVTTFSDKSKYKKKSDI